ncbi:hypothetical protein FF011L_24660 [Roseimaritima multifibrata]|uniref:DUF3311 domain-containing protein n=1 Tax=Roseimaritima multifibrata TaxID=1930274 RepID=A0A517MFM8_9BACT|nr:DUF3311 domain-containing protein [Roseimaritima multifibrata]QDS93693.1 hypothetical protein FF011L_24660 [Roseimaritima multifibrata]
MSSNRTGPLVIAVLVLVLLIVHQDNWNWNDGTLVFGFIPIGLFYHACLSLAATATWLLATKIAWPVELIEETRAALEEQAQEESKDA